MSLQITGRERRKLRIRHKIAGTAERPRLSVFRSLSHMYAQAVDDVSGKTVGHCSTLAKDVKGRVKDAVGGLTGDESLQAEGKLDRVKGKAQDMVGEAQQKLDR